MLFRERRFASSPLPAGFVFDAGVMRDPVHFPGLAAVGGEGLLEVAGVFRDVGNDETHQDGPAVEGLLGVKLAAALAEFAYGRRHQRSVPDAREVQAPLPRLRVVKPQAEPLDAAAGA